MPALRPPVTNYNERLTNPPEYLGELVTDEVSGETFSGQMVDGSLEWRTMSGVPPLTEIGSTILTAEDGMIEAVSLYPYLLNKLNSDLIAIMENKNV